MEFNAIKFAEFIGERGIEVAIIQVENGPTTVRVEAIPMSLFRSLMREFLEQEVKACQEGN